MNTKGFRNEIIKWRFTKYRVVNLIIGICALLLYEFVGRPFYRPFIYSHNIHDFHIADTLGNSLGTIAAVFILVALLSRDKMHGYFLIKTITISLVLFEIAHPLLGKPTDAWDIVATIISGGLCFIMFHFLVKEEIIKVNEE